MFFRGALVILGVWCCLTSGRELTAADTLSPEAIALLEHMEPLWEGMKSDVISSDFEYQLFLQIKPEEECPREKVLTALRDIDLTQGPEQIEKLFQRIGTKKKPTAAFRHLQQQGRRERYTLADKTIVKDEFVTLIADKALRVMRVLDRGREAEGYYNIEYFRAPTRTRADGLQVVAVSREGDQLTIESEVTARDGVPIRTRVDLDWSTGIVQHRRSMREGALYREVLYSGITEYSGGLTIPRVVATLNYREERMTSMDLAVIGKAQFNNPLPDETFLISKPEHWSVLDFRGSAEGTRFNFPATKVDDIRALIPSQPLQLAQAGNTQYVEQPSPWRRGLLAINGVALIGLAIWFWKRSGGQESSRP